jgi:TonB family protein
MLSKTFRYLLVSAILFSNVAMAQQTYTLRFVDEETGAPVSDVFIRGADAPANVDGYVKLIGTRGDSLNIESPTYPVKRMVLGNETSLTVPLSKKFNDTSIFLVVDETAKFPGGMPAYYEYVAKNLTYPQDAASEGIEGKVFIEFVIGRDGNIEKESVRVMTGRDQRLDAEAIRVARESPAWIPGKKDGQAVRQKMVIPYAFKLPKGRKKR